MYCRSHWSWSSLKTSSTDNNTHFSYTYTHIKRKMHVNLQYFWFPLPAKWTLLGSVSEIVGLNCLCFALYTHCNIYWVYCYLHKILFVIKFSLNTVFIVKRVENEIYAGKGSWQNYFFYSIPTHTIHIYG